MERVPLILDIVVILFFAMFVVLFAMLQAPIANLLKQSEKTLDATENLIKTLDKELGPTLNEVHTVIGSVHEIRAIAEKKFQDVGITVDDVSGNITKAAGQAKAETTVWGTGLLAGIRSYLEGKPPAVEDSSQSKSKSKSSVVS